MLVVVVIFVGVVSCVLVGVGGICWWWFVVSVVGGG